MIPPEMNEIYHQQLSISLILPVNIDSVPHLFTLHSWSNLGNKWLSVSSLLPKKIESKLLHCGHHNFTWPRLSDHNKHVGSCCFKMVLEFPPYLFYSYLTFSGNVANNVSNDSLNFSYCGWKKVWIIRSVLKIQSWKLQKEIYESPIDFAWQKRCQSEFTWIINVWMSFGLPFSRISQFRLPTNSSLTSYPCVIAYGGRIWCGIKVLGSLSSPPGLKKGGVCIIELM